MKNSIFLFFALVLTLFACREGNENAASQEGQQQIEEANQLDSLSNELENTTQTIEVQTKALQDALDAL